MSVMITGDVHYQQLKLTKHYKITQCQYCHQTSNPVSLSNIGKDHSFGAASSKYPTKIYSSGSYAALSLMSSKSIKKHPA